MIKEEVVLGKIVFYCSREICILNGYLGMNEREAVEHAEGHIMPRIINIS